MRRAGREPSFARWARSSSRVCPRGDPPVRRASARLNGRTSAKRPGRIGLYACPGPGVARRYSCRAPETPFSSWAPASTNASPESATSSRVVADT